MRQNAIFKLIVGILLLLTINCDYTLNDVIDAAKRVKSHVLKHKDLPKKIKVASKDVSMVQFAYAMGIAIKNIHDNQKESKISTIKLEAPTSPHTCNQKVDLKDYIDAINRVIDYCKKNGAAPAYVTSNSVEIGYKEYAFGFSKILDFYRTEKQLPLYNVFDSSVFEENEPTPGPGPKDSGEKITGVKFLKGINEKSKESDINKYITSSNSACHINEAIKKKARELTKGKSTILDKARAIFNFVRDKIGYKYYDNSIQGAGKTLLLGRGNCCDQTNLLVALCRASKIPARFSHGLNTYFYLSGKTYGGHVWGQILIGKIWYAADTTSNRNSLGTIVNWNINKFGTLNQYINLPF
jgi:hypothetical protein